MAALILALLVEELGLALEALTFLLLGLLGEHPLAFTAFALLFLFERTPKALASRP